MSILKAMPLALTLATIMSGCAKTAPKCGSEETVAIVAGIVRDEMKKIISPEVAERAKIALNFIRTSDVNKSTGKQSCAATLSVKDEKELVLDITYTSELTDKSGEYYVVVNGLDWQQAVFKPLDPNESKAPVTAQPENTVPPGGGIKADDYEDDGEPVPE
jgi:hypothetical protein